MKRSWIIPAIFVVAGLLIGRTVFSSITVKVKGQIIDNQPDCLLDSRLTCRMLIRDDIGNTHLIEYGGNLMAGGMTCSNFITKGFSRGKVEAEIYTSKTGDIVEVYGRKFSLEKFIPDSNNISLCGSPLYYIKRV